MKIFSTAFLLISAFIFTSAIAQNEVRFDDSGYNSVLQRSKKEHKPIFYMFYATWCSHCNKMKAEVFKDKTVAEFMNANFVCAWQDAEKGEGDTFRKKYSFRAYPAFLFFDENGTLLYSFNGELRSEDFIAEAKNALVPENQIPYLEKQFYADISNPDKCLAFLTTLKKGTERTVLNPYAQKYLNTQSDAQLVSEKNWRIIANAVTDIESRPFQYVLQHQAAFAAVSSSKRVEKKIINIVSESLQPYIETLDTVSYFKKRKIAQTVNLHKTDSLIFRYDITVAEKTKNWPFYRKTTTASVEKYIWNDTKAITEIGSNYTKYITDLPSLKIAIAWMLHVLETRQSYDANIIIARLYQKIKDLKSATTYAQKAKDFNAAVGFNTKEAEELLTQLGVK